MAGGGNIFIGGNYQGQGPLANAQNTLVATGALLRAAGSLEHCRGVMALIILGYIALGCFLEGIGMGADHGAGCSSPSSRRSVMTRSGSPSSQW